MRTPLVTDNPTEAERLLQAKLPAHLVKSLRLLAVEQDTTVKELLTRIVQEFIARHRPPGSRAE